jgi:capsular exopolysaccharide synthesis family protein
MGRIDEAMRRATDTPPEAGSAEAAPRAAGDMGTLVAEPFPTEPDATGQERPESFDDPGAAPAEPIGEPEFDWVDVGFAQKVVVDRHMLASSREQYRRLAATLHRAQTETGLKSVMIASAVPSEGKTLTAANLALTLSESYGRRTLLVDADFRRPSLHTIFKVAGSPGLMDGLRRTERAKLPLHQVTERLTVLTAGAPTSDPMAALTSTAMKQVVADARSAFDWVIVDTPPIGLLADANLLAAMLDGTLFVVRADRTPYSLVRAAIEAIGRDHLLGVVLNGASEGADSYGYAYGYGYGYGGYGHYAEAKDKT